MKQLTFLICLCTVFLVFLFMYVSVRALDLDGYTKGRFLVSGGIKRTYDLYVPHAKPHGKRPLVLVIHGHTGSAQKIINEHNPNRAWLDVAQRENFIVVIPNGLVGPDGFTGWNDCRKDNTTNTNVDDLGFIKLLIQTLVQEQEVDPARVYVTGTSNGGHLSLRLAMEAPELIAAAAPVVASMPAINECTPSQKPVPVLFINGTEDPLLPFEGGQVGKKTKTENRGTVMSVEDSISWWVENNGADVKSSVSAFADRDPKDGSTAEKYSYSGSSPVALIKVKGAGHTEPSLSYHYRALFRFIVDGQNRDFETAEEVWAFFKDKAR